MKIALIVSLLVTSLALNAETLQGEVVRVVDGDTITILDRANVQSKIRLNRIDALKVRQYFGEMEIVHESYPSGPLGFLNVDAIRQFDGGECYA